MARNLFKLFIVSFVSSLMGWQGASSMSLNEAVRLALRHDEEVKIKSIELSDAVTAKKLAPLMFIPSVNASASFSTMPTMLKYSSFGELGALGAAGGDTSTQGGPPLNQWLSFSNNNMQNVTVSQNLTLYKMIPELRSAAYAANAKQSEYREFLENTTANVVTLFFDLLEAQKNALLLDKKAQMSARKLASATTYSNSNLIPRLELAKAEAENAESIALRAQAGANLSKLRADYHRQIGSKDEKLEVPSDVFMKLPSKNIDDFIGMVMIKNNQVLKTVNLRKQQYQQKLSAGAALLPDLKLNFQFMNATRMPPILFSYMSLSLMFEVSWQIFDGGKAIYKALSSDKNYRIAVIRERVLRQKLEAEARRAWLIYSSHDNIIIARQKILFAAQQNFQRVKEAFLSKGRSETDLLSAEVELLQSEIDLIKVKADKIKSYYYIMSLVDINPFLGKNERRDVARDVASNEELIMPEIINL